MPRRKGENRIPIYKPADCVGESCPNYAGQDCDARLELLTATGLSGKKNRAPYATDCSYALYGKVCLGGEQQVVVGLESNSPNGQASAAEMIARTRLFEGRTIVLTTPPEDVTYT